MPWKKWLTFFNKSKKVTPSDSNSTTDGAAPGYSGRKSRSKSKKSSAISQLPALVLQQMGRTLKELECPLCENTCIAPIYSCVNGHLICSGCHSLGLNCPVCDETYTNVRNIFAEQFISQFSQSCKYSEQGCLFLKWKGSDMNPHEIGCFYRPLQCIVPSCTFPLKDSIPYDTLLQHLIETHNVHGCNALPAVVSFQTDDAPLVSDRRWLPYYIKSHGCNFYLMLEVRRPHFWAWVWVQSPKLPAAGEGLLGEHYIYLSSIKFQNPERHIYLHWSGPVHTIRTPAEMIIREGLCFSGGETFMQHFEHDNIISLTINIEKKSLKKPRPTYPNPQGSPSRNSGEVEVGGLDSNNTNRRTRVSIIEDTSNNNVSIDDAAAAEHRNSSHTRRGRHHHRSRSHSRRRSGSSSTTGNGGGIGSSHSLSHSHSHNNQNHVPRSCQRSSCTSELGQESSTQINAEEIMEVEGQTAAADADNNTECESDDDQEYENNIPRGKSTTGINH